MGKQQRGFTLIELLVVIAIIGILSSVILASLNGARKKGRDARRISDLKQVQLALELYYDSAGNTYPNDTSVLAPDYIQSVPKDPSDASDYIYDNTGGTAGTAACTASGSTKCTGYILCANLEDGNNPALAGGATGVHGSVTPSPATTPFDYCVVP